MLSRGSAAFRWNHGNRLKRGEKISGEKRDRYFRSGFGDELLRAAEHSVDMTVHAVREAFANGSRPGLAEVVRDAARQ